MVKSLKKGSLVQIKDGQLWSQDYTIQNDTTDRGIIRWSFTTRSLHHATSIRIFVFFFIHSLWEIELSRDNDMIFFNNNFNDWNSMHSSMHVFIYLFLFECFKESLCWKQGIKRTSWRPSCCRKFAKMVDKTCDDPTVCC